MIAPIVLSFDVEEHHRIEAAAHLEVLPERRSDYASRMEASTRRILDLLAETNTVATFYFVGEIGVTHPQLIRDTARAGHEIGMHGYDHRRIHRFTPETFRDDLRLCKEALETASGTPVVGYRAPTFSVVRETAWAIDVLAEEGLTYDSSVYPVVHDRYGIPDAPRTPFLLKHRGEAILELPPLTLRQFGANLPVGGGGYFRIFPPLFMRRGIRQMERHPEGLAMLYFHPWEFDPGQPQLPLKRLSRLRTYAGIKKTTARLRDLIRRFPGRFQRAIDVVRTIAPRRDSLPSYTVDSVGGKS